MANHVSIVMQMGPITETQDNYGILPREVEIMESLDVSLRFIFDVRILKNNEIYDASMT